MSLKSFLMKLRTISEKNTDKSTFLNRFINELSLSRLKKYDKHPFTYNMETGGSKIPPRPFKKINENEDIPLYKNGVAEFPPTEKYYDFWPKPRDTISISHGDTRIVRNENKPCEDSDLIESILERTPSPVTDNPTYFGNPNIEFDNWIYDKKPEFFKRLENEDDSEWIERMMKISFRTAYMKNRR